MAGYDYGYRSGHSNGKEVGTRPNEWSKTSYIDDECRTIIVDADGTQRTIIGWDPLPKPGSYVTKTETIIRERVLSPVYPAAYKHGSPPRTVEPVKEYGYADDKWRRPSSPVKGDGYSADDHKLRRPSSPVKGGGYAADDHKLRRPSSPERDYPQEAGHFLTKVQTDASRDQPSRIGPFIGVNGRQPPQKTGHNGTTGYGDNYGYYQARPNMISNGGHQARPIHSTWTPPPGREGRLTTATDDTETALRYLTESANSSSATTNTPQYSHYSAVPKQDEYPTDTAKRNVRFNAPPWP